MNTAVCQGDAHTSHAKALLPTLVSSFLLCHPKGKLNINRKEKKQDLNSSKCQYLPPTPNNDNDIITGWIILQGIFQP